MNISESESNNHASVEHVYSLIFEAGYYIIAGLGLLCDILIVYAVLKNWRIKSRRNILLMYWAIFDAIGSHMSVSQIDSIVRLSGGPSDRKMRECLFIFSTGAFKLNCVVLMLLLVSTTVARMQFITGSAFQWCICIGTVGIYAFNFCTCYFASDLFMYLIFMFLFFVLFTVVLAKEVNIWCKARRNDPVSDETRLKMNVVRIYTYFTSVIFLIYLFTYGIRRYIFLTEFVLHFTSLFIFVYLCNADVNFKTAFGYCYKKWKPQADAPVVYNVDEN